METRSNKILVSLVVGLVLAAIVAFALWLTASRRSTGRPYDIVINQSVSGLVVGSPVTFSGVPVGRVTSVGLDKSQPGAVRVRIDITDDDLLMAEGTVAHLNGDLLFGTTLLSLERTTRSDKPLMARAEGEAPVIPLEGGGLGDLVSDPTPMVESIAFATDRLLAATTPEQQRLLVAKLQAMERASAEAAAQAPQMGARIAPARASLQASATSAAAMAQQARTMRRDLDARGRTASRDLRASLASAREATAALNKRLGESRPAVRTFSESIEKTGSQIAAAREGVAGIKESVQQVERGGAGSLLSGPPTPDYKPKR
ncbi:MAG TPA: MlaD family protein [Allosphingosinicella sp.]